METKVNNTPTAKPLSSEDTAVTLNMIWGRLEEIAGKLDEGGRGSRQSQRDMTEDDARKVLTDLKDKKHNEAADELGLSYGQVYSCRLGYTFKGVRADLQKAGVKNQWLDTNHNSSNNGR
jgi:hypothetical protein